MCVFNPSINFFPHCSTCGVSPPKKPALHKGRCCPIEASQISEILLPGVSSASVAAFCYAHFFPFKHGWVFAGIQRFFFGFCAMLKRNAENNCFLENFMLFHSNTHFASLFFCKRDLTEWVLQRLSDRLHRGVKVNLFT